jgi:beta-lactam-binding protein with PASTA domain
MTSGTGTCAVRYDQAGNNNYSAAPEVTETVNALSAPQCVVPKLKRKTFKAAKRALRTHSCSLGKVKRAFSNRVKKGRVISQSPKPGRHLSHGAKVRLVVSKGRRA